MFDLKRFSSRRTRKSRRIENDRVKSFTSPSESRQHGSHVVRDKTMVHGWKIVERKVLASAREILFRKINVEGDRAATCRAHGKRAGVSKTVQQPLWRDMTHVAAILSLVQKQTG